MRSLARALSLLVTLSFLAGSAWAQPGPYACGPGGCPPGGCGNGTCCSPYPRYCGYGVSSSNYYQPPPPLMLGGPAYGYTFPCPWGAYCPPPKTYIAPANPSYYYYPFPYGPYGGQSHSYYAGYPQYYGYRGNPGTVFATERVKPAAPAAAPTSTARTSMSAKLPETAAAKTTTPPAADAAKKPSFLQRLLFWQK